MLLKVFFECPLPCDAIDIMNNTNSAPNSIHFFAIYSQYFVDIIVLLSATDIIALALNICFIYLLHFLKALHILNIIIIAETKCNVFTIHSPY